MVKIDPSYYLSNNQQRGTPSPELGKDEFLKILVAQLQNQDPLNPMEDKEFISQMTTFSSLEQLMNMSNSIETLVQSQLVSPVIQYSHMIGKTVSYEKEDEDTKEKEIIESTVVSVSQKNDEAVLELANGEKIYADTVIKVSEQSE